MKKINKYLLMGSVALTGAMGLASCSSEDTPDTPGNGDVTAVKTQFALNIPRANGGTRMSESNTQGGGNNFLGIEDIHMYTFDAEPGNSSTSTSSVSNLGSISKDYDPNITENSSSKIFSDVTVPVGTKYFLFYGHASQGNGKTNLSDENNFKLGTLAVEFGGATTATSSISPTLVPVKINDDTKYPSLLAVLNKVAQVSNFATTSNTELKRLYDNFITLKAGSANNIKLALQMLYNNVHGAISSAAIADKAAIQTVANAIRTAITEDGTFTVTGTEGSYVLTTTNTYPNDINLPDGAVMLEYTTANGFTYARNSDNVGTGTNVAGNGFMGLNANSICFPASIYYFQSSDLAASANVLEIGSWPKTTTEWSNNAPWKDNSWGSEVTSTTRSIAMRQNINYGVASLKFAAKCKNNPLKDKDNKDVTLAAAGFPVTGILIGGQPSSVGYNFQPNKTGETFPMVVYDKDITGVNANYNASNTSATSENNYTIVLPNEKNGGTQDAINIAVEFENNTGVDFRGADGIVPAGGKFYLVGKLDPSLVTSQTIAGKTNPAVFMSDYQTTVTINVSSLANAYNTIPDLRSTKMQLGISVDLTWQQGLSFEVELN